MSEFQQAIYEIDLYGFTIVKEVLTPDEVASLTEALIWSEQEVGETRPRPGACRHVANLPILNPIFFPVIDHPRVLPLLEHYLGPHLILGSLNSRIVRPGDDEQGFHSDIPVEMLNMDTPVMMNTVWILDDFSPKTGGTRIVPGTHKSGMGHPPDGFEVKHVCQPTASAGSVLVFNGQCWHAGGANHSEHNRHALFAHYRKRMLMFQYDPHDGFPDEWYGKLSDRQKELMRMRKGTGVPHAADVHGA